MKELFSVDHEGFFLFRTHLFPNKKINNKSQFINFLKTNVLFAESLLISSPILFKEFQKCLQKEDFEERVLNSLYKYYLRMSSRPTPFGTFSGCSYGKIGSKTELSIENINNSTFSLEIDFNYLWEIIDLVTTKVLKGYYRDSVKFLSNSNYYKVQNKIRYIEFSQNFSKSFICSLDDDFGLEEILKYCTIEKTFNQVKDFIVLTFDVEIEEAELFVIELINNSLLLNELHPPVISNAKDILSELLKKFSDYNLEELELLIKLSNYKSSIKYKKLGENLELFKEFYSFSRQNFFKGKTPWKVDMKIGVKSCTIDAKSLDTLKESLQILYSSQYNNYVKLIHPNLKEFILAFKNAYGENKVSFLKVLDPDLGLGYPINERTNETNPLLSGISFKKNGKKFVQNHTIDEWNYYLLNKINDSNDKRLPYIELKENEINEFLKLREALPSKTFYSNYSLIKNNNIEIFLHKVTTGPTSLRILNRFSILDKKLEDKLRTLVTNEINEDSDAIYAEINYNLNYSGLNIASRKDFYEKQIEFLPSNSGNISLNEISVFVENDQIVLWSEKENKRIIPRLSTPHMLNYSLPHYRFLAELQYQNTFSEYFWDWGPLGNSNYLPRVIYKNVVLKLARWQLDIKDFDYDSSLSLYVNLRLYFSKYKIPRHFHIVFADNYLPIDCKNIMTLDVFYDYFKKNKTLLIYENLEFNNQAVISNLGFHNCEIIIPWKLEKNPQKNFSPILQNNYYPGDEWLYFKIYMNSSSIDHFLISLFDSIISVHINKLFTDFFFIRFQDNLGDHIRIRFKFNNKEFISQFLFIFNDYIKYFISENIVFKYKIDTYEPEVRRYGLLNMKNIEKYFFWDSLCVSSLIKFCLYNESNRIRIALAGMDFIFSDFSINLKERINICKSNRLYFGDEFDFDNSLNRNELATKFREYKNFVFESLDNRNDFEFSYLFSERSLNTVETVSKITTQLSKKDLYKTITNLCHLFLNRLFKNSPREQELIIYDFLVKYYIYLDKMNSQS